MCNNYFFLFEFIFGASCPVRDKLFFLLPFLKLNKTQMNTTNKTNEVPTSNKRLAVVDNPRTVEQQQQSVFTHEDTS